MDQKDLPVIDGYITDARGNRASVDFWGSEKAARASLETLENCSNCTNCTNCSGCSDCSDCSYCSGCSYCSDCSGCSDCSDCSRCSGCSDCSGCSRCFRCSDCSDKKGQVPPIPKIDNIDAAVYAAASQPDALNMVNWHTCETTHCRAGWVVHLAGDEGRALESYHNTELAALLIYRESGSPINPARFYDSDDAALKDMKMRAEKN